MLNFATIKIAKFIEFICLYLNNNVPLQKLTIVAMRILLIVTLMFNILGFGKQIKANIFVYDRPSNDEQLQCYDGFFHHMAEEPQAPIGVVLRSMPSSHRVGSSRPTRLLPTQGGKPTHHSGRWALNEWYNLSNGLILLSYKSFNSSRAMAASQRLYYVIALRRLLC